MEPLGSQLPVYTRTARAIAPQNRLIAPEPSRFSTSDTRPDLPAASQRATSSAYETLRGSLGNAGDLVDQASSDLSRIGDALDAIDALVETAEENSDLSRQQRSQLTTRIEDYLAEIDDIAARSSFNGENLLAADRTVTLQVGSGTSSGNRLDVELFASGTENLATGLSLIDLSDDAGVATARSRVDEAQLALRDREISLQTDTGSLARAQDQNRISQVAGDNILQAQLAASEPSGSDDIRARITENLQAYLGDIARQFENQTVTIGGFALPEPQADPQPQPRPQPEPQTDRLVDPFDDPNESLVPDQNANRDDATFDTLFTPSTGASTSGSAFSVPAFSSYDSGGKGASDGASSGTGRISVEA